MLVAAAALLTVAHPSAPGTVWLAAASRWLPAPSGTVWLALPKPVNPGIAIGTTGTELRAPAVGQVHLAPTTTGAAPTATGTAATTTAPVTTTAPAAQGSGRPVAQSGAAAAVAPISKPVEKPVTKPSDAPAPRPAETPAPRPSENGNSTSNQDGTPSTGSANSAKPAVVPAPGDTTPAPAPSQAADRDAGVPAVLLLAKDVDKRPAAGAAAFIEQRHTQAPAPKPAARESSRGGSAHETKKHEDGDAS